MNNNRRKNIEKIWNSISELKSQLETILEEEQESYDNLPEGIQDSERGEKMQTAIDNIESSISSLEEVESFLEESVQ